MHVSLGLDVHAVTDHGSQVLRFSCSFPVLHLLEGLCSSFQVLQQPA